MAKKKPEAAKRMWGGRFSRPPAKAAEEFSRSLHFDARLALCDIKGSAAHARALNRAGILSAQELAAISGGLEKLRATVAAGKADFTTGEEDIHSWVENRLRDLVGEPADKLHTGRSRNDQVALDAFVGTTQRRVAGQVRLSLYKGTCRALGRRSPFSLYDKNLATYEAGDTFDHKAGEAFTKLWGLPLKIQGRVAQRARKR